MINLLLFFAVVLWGLSFIGTKMALEFLTPVEIIAIRLILGTPILYLILKFKKANLVFKKSDYPVLIVAALILGLHFVIQALGLIYTTATNTAWLIATIPVFIAVLSYTFLREKLTSGKIVGIFIATSGVLLLVSQGRPGSLGWLNSIGDWIILFSCITWSFYTIVTRNITRICDPLKILTAILIPPAVILTVVTIFISPWSKFASLPGEILLVLVFLGVFCLGIAHWFWLEGLAKKGATEIGVFLYFEPIVTTVAAISILGEKLTVFLVIGAILIIFGVYLVERKRST